MSDAASKYKNQLLIFGALLAIWGILGWIDVGNLAQGGWAEDGNNTVTQVLPGSPSEAAVSLGPMRKERPDAAGLTLAKPGNSLSSATVQQPV